MKRETFLSGILLVCLCGVLFSGPGCKKDEPPVVWDPNQAGAATPFITSANPPAKALGGVTQVTLTGGNFSPVDSLNSVYFGGAAAKIVSASATQLVVIAPDTLAPSLTIRVAVAGAYILATYGPYSIEHVAVAYGDFTSVDEVYSLTVDASENLYTQMHQFTVADTPIVYQITPAGLKTVYGKTFPLFTKASDMKIGPGGYLYMQQTSTQNIHRIAPGGGASSLWATLPGTPLTVRSSSIDFDSSGNLYAGGTIGGLFVVSPAGSARSVGSYPSNSIRSVRVFAGSVYLLVDAPTKRVYRNTILNSNGDLGPNTQVFDWTNAGTAYAASALLSLTFAADGDMYLGTDNANPILVVHPDGTSAPLYPGTLIPPATQMVWGTGAYLYVNRDISPDTKQLRAVLRLAMGKNGAPYYGRGL